jgi:hypothetical protein
LFLNHLMTKEKELNAKLTKAVEFFLRLDAAAEQEASGVKKSERVQARIHSADLEVDVQNLQDDEGEHDSSYLDEDELAEMRLELSKHTYLQKATNEVGVVEAYIFAKGYTFYVEPNVEDLDRYPGLKNFAQPTGGPGISTPEI